MKIESSIQILVEESKPSDRITMTLDEFSKFLFLTYIDDENFERWRVFVYHVNNGMRLSSYLIPSMPVHSEVIPGIWEIVNFEKEFPYCNFFDCVENKLKGLREKIYEPSSNEKKYPYEMIKYTSFQAYPSHISEIKKKYKEIFCEDSEFTMKYFFTYDNKFISVEQPEE